MALCPHVGAGVVLGDDGHFHEWALGRAGTLGWITGNPLIGIGAGATKFLSRPLPLSLLAQSGYKAAPVIQGAAGATAEQAAEALMRLFASPPDAP